MKVLVTGGSGVIGNGLIPELLAANHSIRLLSRHASDDAEKYPDELSSFDGDVSNPEKLKGAVDGCQCIVHVAGIVEELPPDTTFTKVNVKGTQNLLEEAKRAGNPLFIYLSSLGADKGKSAYHKSKLAAEELVKSYPGNWLIFRPGNVYGPGDDVISMLLKMVRSLPAVPVIADGEQKFQPIWYSDLGKIIVESIQREYLHGEILEVAGAEVVTTNEVIDCLAEITGRSPAKLAIPQWAADFGTTLLESSNGAGQNILKQLGVGAPVNSSKLQMLEEENVIEGHKENAFLTLFDFSPTSLQDGLEVLADCLPEQTLADGVASAERKTFTAEINGCRFNAEELMGFFLDNISEVMPLEFGTEPGAAGEEGTYTAAIAGRGNVQIRLEERLPHKATFATLEGHPLSGLLMFEARDTSGSVAFQITTIVRAANVFDWAAMRTVGGMLQNQNWRNTLKRLAELAGGNLQGAIKTTRETLSKEEVTAEAERLDKLIKKRKRSELKISK